MKRLLVLTIVVDFAMVAIAYAQPPGPRNDPSRQHDIATFQFLLRHRDEITRQLTKLPNGVETLTESQNPAIVAELRDHVKAMHLRLKSGRPIHLRDSLFRAVFQHSDQIEMEIEKTPQGLKVRETSQDPYVAKLIKAHAEVVNQFLAKGHEEVRKDHAPPTRSDPAH
jgi:hypothetical protein